MKNLVSVAAAAALTVGLAACGKEADQHSSTPESSASATSSPTAAEKPPLRIDEEGPSCNEQTTPVIQMYPFDVSTPTTVGSFDLAKGHGLPIGQLSYPLYPARVEGRVNALGPSGTSGLRMPDHVAHLRGSMWTMTNWKKRQRLIGATLQPGEYWLFVPITRGVSKRGGTATSWKIGWTTTDGATGTSTWKMGYTAKRHCPSR